MPLPDLTTEDHQTCVQLARCDELTLLLDLDGTLIPFAPTAEAATLDDEIVDILRDLHRAGIHVGIVSGRPRALVESLCERVGDIWWMAEHGSWRRDAAGPWSGPSTAPELARLVEMLAPFTKVPGTRIEHKSLSVCLHWRLVPESLRQPLVDGAELVCDEWLETHPEFQRLEGVEMLEVRQRSANKSLAVAWARQRVPGTKLIAIGDDETDEDMFRALREDDLAIGVGPRGAPKRCWLSGPTTVRSFLRWLIEVRQTGDPRPFLSLECHHPSKHPAKVQLLVVSNRTPSVSGSRDRSVGGLVSALEPALRTREGMWLGWSGNESNGERHVLVDYDARPVRASFDLPSSWREQFYSGFCNSALWPLFHGFPGRVRYANGDWLAYVDANADFARHAEALAAPDGTIWVHDYHLLLVAHGLRQRGFHGRLGLFLHVPFPQRDLFDTLPWADDIIRAMLDFDLIGFHTEQWAQNFRDCARGRTGARELPAISVLPIGVDPSSFAIADEPIDRDVAGLRAALGPRRLILGVDRLDFAKGIPERLLAFERLLESHPEWRSQVSFVQISVPSRADVPEYGELREWVEKLVGRINGRFGEADWVPVRYLYRSYDHRVLAQLYRAASVALVTPLRDGLNLVAKEFVVSQDASDPGVLVLSRFAGAAAELGDAVLTNPYHPEGLADDIDTALRMDLGERKRRHGLLSAALEGKTPQLWATAFLDRLAVARYDIS